LFAKVREDADQLKAAELIATEPVVVLSGKGGCGKTEVVGAVVSYAISKINSEKYASYPLLFNPVQISQLVTFSEKTPLVFVKYTECHKMCDFP